MGIRKWCTAGLLFDAVDWEKCRANCEARERKVRTGGASSSFGRTSGFWVL